MKQSELLERVRQGNQWWSVDGSQEKCNIRRKNWRNLLEDLQCLVNKAYPEELNEIQEHLVICGVLEGIHNSQVRFGLTKSPVDAELKIETVQEKNYIMKPSQDSSKKINENRKSQLLNPTRQEELCWFSVLLAGFARWQPWLASRKKNF